MGMKTIFKSATDFCRRKINPPSSKIIRFPYELCRRLAEMAEAAQVWVEAVNSLAEDEEYDRVMQFAGLNNIPFQEILSTEECATIKFRLNKIAELPEIKERERPLNYDWCKLHGDLSDDIHDLISLFADPVDSTPLHAPFEQFYATHEPLPSQVDLYDSTMGLLEKHKAAADFMTAILLERGVPAKDLFHGPRPSPRL